MKKSYFSYIRVSTVKQGTTGTSLAEQQAAIQRYAEQMGLTIAGEYVEKETAAKRGRPIFMQMIKAIEQGVAEGVIIHKIDRSARNLGDWANLGELVDRGVDVHFANESLDLHSRGGRLSADIQAVVAADFIRNLREETKKGFYGRIKQGLYPRPAPIGYLNCGKGQPKILDPLQAPLVRKAFELYASGSWGLDALVEKMYELGLRSKKRKQSNKENKVTRNGLSTMFHNPFYIGVIRINKVNELFPGRHPALITKKLFDQVQDVLAGKNIKKTQKHFFKYRKLITCAGCTIRPSGEIHKGYIYYRCHTKNCPQRCFREEVFDGAVLEFLKKLELGEQEIERFQNYLQCEIENMTATVIAQTQALKMQLEQLEDRLSKLTDAYIDGVVDKESYLNKKSNLILEEKEIKEKLATVTEDKGSIFDEIQNFFHLAKSSYLSYQMGNEEEKREMVKIVFSTLMMEGEKIIVKPHYPFQIVADREIVTVGSPQLATFPPMPAWLSQLFDFYFGKMRKVLKIAA